MSFRFTSARRPLSTPIRRSVTVRKLQNLLLSKPPAVEIVSRLEAYLTDTDGKRTKRICGSKLGRTHTSSYLPDFVPGELRNPWNIVNPRKQYVCLRPAGWKTDHKGVGPCKQHGKEKDREALKNPFLGVDKVSSDKDFAKDAPNLLLEIGDFDSFLLEAKAKTTPDQLLDITRPLYELEALKLMTIDWMKQFGFNGDAIESIAKRIQEAANVQLILAKRDHEIIRNKAIAAMIRVFVTGFLSIVQSELLGDPAKARQIAKRFNDELLLPVQNIGLTEILKRQESSGDYNRVVELAEFEDFTEEDQLVVVDE